MHLQIPEICLNIWDLLRYSSRTAILKSLWLAVMLLGLLAKNIFWCQTKRKVNRFAANMTVDMQHQGNFMGSTHIDLVWTLSVYISVVCGGLKHNLYWLQIHKEEIYLNECDGSWYLQNPQMCPATSDKQKYLSTSAATSHRDSTVSPTQEIRTNPKRHFCLMPTRLKLAIHWC